MSRTSSKSHYHHYHKQIRHAKNGPRGKLSRCELLYILGAYWFFWLYLLRLDWYIDLDIFSKIVIVPKYEPIRMLREVVTSKIILSNSVAQNKQNFSIWLWKIRQSAIFFQSDHSNGWNFWNCEPMGALEGGTNYWINWTNEININRWSSQTKFGRWDNRFWTVKSNFSEM